MSESLRPAAERAFAFAQEQVAGLVRDHPDHLPLFTRDGKWLHDQEAWTHWCDGFPGGMMWIFARRTGDPWWREQAERYSRLIEPRKDDRDVHDLGFLFYSTWKRWFDLTGDPAVENVVVHAGRTLALRFNPRGRYLASFIGPESTFVDIMANIRIVYYAAHRTGDAELRRVADEHSLTTRRHLVRGDGSTVHEGIFDPASGEFLRESTHQGWRGDGSWARGLTWALYGFANAYQFTGDERFLDTAVRCAEFYIARTPEHGVPQNDWEEPDPAYAVESSAAAIGAAGFLQLAATLPAGPQADRYRAYGHRIVATLCSRDFLADATPGWEGILRHGIYHQRKGLGVDESVMWGEYFFVEALDAVLAEGA